MITCHATRKLQFHMQWIKTPCLLFSSAFTISHHHTQSTQTNITSIRMQTVHITKTEVILAALWIIFLPFQAAAFSSLDLASLFKVYLFGLGGFVSDRLHMFRNDFKIPVFFVIILTARLWRPRLLYIRVSGFIGGWQNFERLVLA